VTSPIPQRESLAWAGPADVGCESLSAGSDIHVNSTSRGLGSLVAQKAKSPNPEVEEADRPGLGDDAASDRVIGPESHDESEDAKAKEQHGRAIRYPRNQRGSDGTA
jgi:hypothetical protein